MAKYKLQNLLSEKVRAMECFVFDTDYINAEKTKNEINLIKDILKEE